MKAFPVQEPGVYEYQGIDTDIGQPVYKTIQKPYSSQGMDLRDYFAAKAMQALIGTERAQGFVGDDGLEMGDEAGACGTLFIHTDWLAKESYEIADRMIIARQKDQS